MTYNEIIKNCVTNWLKEKLKMQKIENRMKVYAFSSDPHETCKSVNPNDEPTGDIDELLVTFGKDIRVVVSIERTPEGWQLKTERKLTDILPTCVVAVEDVTPPSDISNPPHDFNCYLVGREDNS